MTDKIIVRSKTHENRPNKNSLDDPTESLSRARELEEARNEELDRQLTILGFPDGGAIRRLRTERMEQFQQSGHKSDCQKSKGSVVEDMKQEFWDLTHAEGEKFIPTLKPDARDWSPYVIKANYHAWARRAARQYGFSDDADGEEMNAFRHAATAAVFTLKYGPKTAFLLGAINELITESGAVAMGHMSQQELADCSADLLNNKAGINIVRRWLNDGRHKEEITLQEITDEIAHKLKVGGLVTKPMDEWRKDNIAPELKMLLGKP
jgi:hypothetical protein